MAVLDVPLLSGFRADIESLEQVRWRRQAGSPADHPVQMANSRPFIIFFFAFLGKVGAFGLGTC